MTPRRRKISFSKRWAPCWLSSADWSACNHTHTNNKTDSVGSTYAYLCIHIHVCNNNNNKRKRGCQLEGGGNGNLRKGCWEGSRESDVVLFQPKTYWNQPIYYHIWRRKKNCVWYERPKNYFQQTNRKENKYRKQYFKVKRGLNTAGRL